MMRRPPNATRTDALVPSTTHFRSRQGDAGAERGDAQRRTAVQARIAFGQEPGRQLVVRRDDGPAALLGLDEQMNEVRVRDTEDGVDAFGFKQLEDALINLHRATFAGNDGSGGRGFFFTVHALYLVPCLSRLI